MRPKDRIFLFLLGAFLFLGLAQAQDAVYKLRVTEWGCEPGANGVVVARGTVVNQSGRTLRDVRVNLRVVDQSVEVVNGVSNDKVYGTNSAPIAVSSLANGASSRFEVQVRPSSSEAIRCQIWFRNSYVAQIPTLVPKQR
jgi:hypothetical protein